MATPPTCATCKAYQAADAIQGFCHFWPPKITAADQASTTSAWPPVKSTGWCLQHKRRWWSR